jgi:hypothetical protein
VLGVLNASLHWSVSVRVVVAVLAALLLTACLVNATRADRRWRDEGAQMSGRSQLVFAALFIVALVTLIAAWSNNLGPSDHAGVFGN